MSGAIVATPNRGARQRINLPLSANQDRCVASPFGMSTGRARPALTF